MKIVIYTKDNCSFCVKAKALFKIHSLEYTEYKVGEHITREDFIFLFPEQKTLPLIFIDDEKLGGFNELRTYLTDKTA